MGIGDIGSDQITSYTDTIQRSISSQNTLISDIESKNDQLQQKQQVQIDQLKQIEDKEKLLLTRSRMLQISQDRNSYKKKIIYTLLATIFLLFIITIALYVYFVRAKAPNNSNKFR
jgi:predicted PurR-regulated permease PerM